MISITKTILLPAFLVLSSFSWSQNAKESSSARVAITVTDMKGKVQGGQAVLFISAADSTQFVFRTDVAGKAMAVIPTGDFYTVKLKTLTDTAMYTTLEIPALQTGHFYTAPFTMEIEFEPPRSFTLDNVYFDTGKPTLRTESFKELDEIAEYMKWNEGERYEIGGHTDNVGKDQDNLKLSQLRAITVRAYFLKKGIKSARLTAKGYGAAKPIADNNTEEGKQTNRRTELKVL